MANATTAEPPRKKGAALSNMSAEQRKAFARRGNLARQAKSIVLGQMAHIDTVSRTNRDKLGLGAQLIIRGIKWKTLKVCDLKDLKTLVEICDTVHGWSAKDAPKAHLHLHSVGKLLNTSEQVRPQAVVVDSEIIKA